MILHFFIICVIILLGDIMFYFFIIYILVCLYGLKFDAKNVDSEDFISRKTTLAINGIFVGIIFFSHFNSYINFTNNLDLIYLDIVSKKIGQLMVCPFLFFSGYGIFESIKTKSNYMNTFFKNRILKLFISFAIIIFLYIILNSILGYHYSVSEILLSFIGFESIGNSNWFIFATFCLYLITLFSFKIEKNNLNSIIIVCILSFLYIIFVHYTKGYAFWYNTIFCYAFGMLFSYFKTNIINFLKVNKSYFFTFLLLILAFLLGYKSQSNYLVYEIYSVIFVLLIVFLNMKFKIGNKLLLFLGKNTFNIYAIQRLFFILFKHLGLIEYNMYLYFFASLLSTLLLSYIVTKLYSCLFKYLKLS